MAFLHAPGPYIALIGDMRDSRKAAKRGDLQRCLQGALDEINQNYAPSIAAKFTITLGDEFQGLLHAGQRTMDMLWDIRAGTDIAGIQLRFGIGLGEITTDINPDLAIGADGPAYYRARTAIERLKADERKKSTAPAFARLGLDEGDETMESALNTALVLLSAIEADWTDRQWQIAYAMARSSGGQTAVAEQLGLAQSTVQKSLSASRYYAHKQGMDLLAAVLAEVGGDRV